MGTTINQFPSNGIKMKTERQEQKGDKVIGFPQQDVSQPFWMELKFPGISFCNLVRAAATSELVTEPSPLGLALRASVAALSR